MVSLPDRLAGGLVGLLVGDALGVPYEFHARSAIPPREFIEFDPPAGFRRTYPSIPAGTWSDDGAQALCLLDALLSVGACEPRALAGRLRQWYENGYLAVDGVVFDVGIATRSALDAMTEGADPATAGGTSEGDNGNGSLMRVLPLALWHRGSDAQLVADAHALSKPTHGHARSQVACAFYCLWARRLLEGCADGWAEATAALRACYCDAPWARFELEHHLRPDERIEGGGSGYVIDSLWSARQCLAEPTYADVVRAAVALGGDTDTTACIAGGLAGIRFGRSAIPERWQRRLRGAELYQPLLAGLLAVRSNG
ncbi:MAG: ADP-ribosylglycohydrolase family protein [Planctomycetes bacterium]|nr:ADP-ribosylglycohydrolase family protein [Planctomycetota bacterium]